MKKRIKQILIVFLAFACVLSFPFTGKESYADSLPYVDDYVELKVWVNGSKTSEVAYTIKGNVYIKTSTLSKYGDISKLKIDTENLKVSFNVSDMNVSFGSSEATDFIKKNAGTCYVPIKTFQNENGKNDTFVSLGPVAQMARLVWSYQNNTLYLTQYSAAGNIATTGIIGNTAASLRNKSVASLSSGETVFIEDETTAFYKIKDGSGNIYYVKKSEISKVGNSTQVNDFEYIPSSKDSFSGKINLTFLNLADNALRTPLPPDVNGAVDVLAPPWMHQMVNEDGFIRHICDYGYVQLAHDMGMKVWITVNNCFTTTGSTKFTTKVMETEKLSDKVIAQYLFYACLHNADGICLDYEDLLKADRDAYTAFNLKLAKYCDLLGLTYSVCTSIPTAYNSMYNWDELGKHCDYIIPMTYVEHMANKGSQATEDTVNEDGSYVHGNLGSVSSYKWYKEWMDKLKELVPPEKILMGVPFFSRSYYVESNRIKASGTITMSSAHKRVKQMDAQTEWNEADQQFVARYKDEEGTPVILWLEDPHSLAVRLNYVLESGIGGTACWALEQIDTDTLKLFKDIYKDGISPSDYYYQTYYNE